MATPKIIADFESSLATAIAVSGTSFTLSSATDDDGIALPSGLYYFTVDNGDSNKEYLSGTLSGTSVTGVSTVSRQGVETSGAARAHRVGASVIITDFATYKVYMDQIALVSAPDASPTVKGVVEEATQAEVDAGTTSGATTARLYQNPGTIRAKAYHDYAADAGSTDAYAITITPAITAYATGQVFVFKANTANTGAATLTVSGLTAKTIKKSATLDLATGDIVAGQIVTVIYDGTNMQLQLSPPALPTSQVFAASGTYTKPSGLKYAIVEAVGGGGGGCAISGVARGGGGGGGGYGRWFIPAGSIGATETVTIGAAGSAGSNSAGGNGGNTSFGALAIANGGNGGADGAGGAGGAVAGSVTASFSFSVAGGTPLVDTTPTPDLENSGEGGDSFWGQGGAARATAVGSGAGTMVGAVGRGYGAGASGSIGSTTGAAGTIGYMVVTEYY